MDRAPSLNATLDVYDEEPLAAGHPLTKLPNVILLPHQGHVVIENYRILYQGAVDDIRARPNGTIRNHLTDSPGPGPSGR